MKIPERDSAVTPLEEIKKYETESVGIERKKKR